MDQPSSEPEDGEIKTEDEDYEEVEGEYLPIGNRRTPRKGGRGRGRHRNPRRKNFEDNSRQPRSQSFTRSRHVPSSSKPYSRGRRRQFVSNFNQRRREQPPEFPPTFGKPPFQRRASGTSDGRRNSGPRGRRRESTSVSSISSEDEQGTSSKAVPKPSQHCNGVGGIHAKPSTLKAEASTSKPQSTVVGKSKTQHSQDMEQVSDDDDQESVIFVPTVRKSPVIITLDVTDTSEDEEKVDVQMQNENKTDSSKSQQDSSNSSHQESHNIPTASNSGIEQRILNPRPIPRDLTGSFRAAAVSSSASVEIRNRDLTGTVRPIIGAAAEKGAANNHCSSVSEIRINNVVDDQPSVSNLHGEIRDGDEPYSPSATIDSSESNMESTTPPRPNRIEEEDDIAVLELRNELLADLMSKIPGDGVTPEAAKLPTVEKDDETKKAEKTPNKSSSKAPPTNGGIDSDEEQALRDVLLSQMKIKKAKRQENVVPNGTVAPSTSSHHHHRHEKSSKTEHKKSKPISPIKVSKTSSSSSSTTPAPRSIVSRSTSSRTSSDSIEKDHAASHSSSSRYNISNSSRSSSMDKLTARRRRFHDTRTSSEDTIKHTDKRTRHEHFPSCMDPINPSLHQPEVHRVVRVVDEPLLPQLPKRVIKKKSLRNLPPSDLRRKLIRNAKHKNDSPQISPLGRDFALADTDLRHLNTTPEDFTIQRTVNFTNDSCTISVASSSRREMEPVTIEIPPPNVQFQEQKTPQGYQASPHSPPLHLQQQSSPAIVVHMSEQPSPVHPLFGSLSAPIPPTPEGSTFAQISPHFGVLPKIGAQTSPTMASLAQSNRLGIVTPFMQNHPQVSPGSQAHMHSPQLPLIHQQQQVSPGQYYMQMQQHHQQPQSPYTPPFIATPSGVSQHSFGVDQEYNLRDNNGISQFSPHMLNTSHVPGIPLPSPQYVESRPLPSPQYVESRNSVGAMMYPMSQTPIMSIPGYPTPPIGTGGPDVDYRILSPAPPNVFLNQPPNQNNPSCMYGGGSNFSGNSLPMYHPFQAQSPMVTTIPSEGNYQGLSVYAAPTGAPMQTMQSHQYMNGLPINVPYTAALTIDTTEANRMEGSKVHFRPIVDTNSWDSPQSPDVADTPINCMRTLAFEDPSKETKPSVSVARPPSTLEVSASGMSGVRVSSMAQCNYSPNNSHPSTSKGHLVQSSNNHLQTEKVKGTVPQQDINNRLMKLAESSDTKLSSPVLPKRSSRSRKTAPILPEVIIIDDEEQNKSPSSRKQSPENSKTKAPANVVAITKSPVATTSCSSGAPSKVTLKELSPKSPAITPTIARVILQSVPSKSPTGSPYCSDDEQRNVREGTKSQLFPAVSVSSPPPKSSGGAPARKISPSTTTKLISPTSSNDSGISEISTTPTSEVARNSSTTPSMTSLVSQSPAGSNTKGKAVNTTAMTVKPVLVAPVGTKTQKTVETPKSLAPAAKPNAVISKPLLPTVIIASKAPLAKAPPPVKRMKRIIIPVRDDDTSTSEDESICTSSDGGGVDSQFQAKLDEFLKNTRHLVEQRNTEQKKVESTKEVVKVAPRPQLPKQVPVPSKVSNVEAPKTVKVTVLDTSAPKVSTPVPPPPQPTRSLNQSTVPSKPANGITNQEPKLVQKTPSLAEKIKEAIEKAGRLTPAQARLAALETTKSKQIAASSNAKLLETQTSVQNSNTPTVKPTPANIPKATPTKVTPTTSTSKGSPGTSSKVTQVSTPTTVPLSTSSKIVSPTPTKITSATTPNLSAASTTLTTTPTPTKESQNSATKPKAKPQSAGRPTPKPSTPVTPSTSKATTATLPSLDTMSSASSAELINELMKKITESRDHLALSSAEKKLLSARQRCVKDIREIKNNLEQHARFTNLATATQSEISELEKKIDLLKSRKSVMDARANILNSNVIKLSKPLLVTRAQCVKLTQVVKKMGHNVIGSQYKVTDMFVNDIQVGLKSLERLHSLQEVHLQTQRGIEFHQLIGKKAWQPKSVIAKSSVSPGIATSSTLTPSASALRNSAKPTPVVTQQTMESTTGKESVNKAAKTSQGHQSANQKLSPVGADTNPPHSETIEEEVIGFLTRHATSTYPPDGQKLKAGQKRKRANSLRINLKEPLSEPSGGVRTQVDLRSHIESPLKFFRQKGKPAPVVDSNLQLCPEWLEGNCVLMECAFQHLI